MVPKLLERFNCVEIHVRLRVIVRQVRARAVLIELRAGFDLEAVAGNVVRLEVDHVPERLHPLLARLIGKAKHQVNRDVIKARAPCHRDGLLCLLVVVRSSKRFELLVNVRLYADGNPVKARAPQLRQHRKRHGVGVCLERHLRVAAHIKAAVNFGKDPAQARRSEKRRRAASKVDRIDLVANGAGRGLADVGDDRVEVSCHQLLAARAGDGVKVAVFTFAAAERDVDIDAEALFPALYNRNPAHRVYILILHRASTPP